MVILGRRANQGGSTNIDILYAGLEIAAPSHRFLEGVEIDHDEVDRLDILCGHSIAVSGVVANAEDAAMHFRVKRLHPTIQHFGKFCVFGNVFYRDAGVAQGFCCAAGRENFDTRFQKKFPQLSKTRFIGYGNQSARNKSVLSVLCHGGFSLFGGKCAGGRSAVTGRRVGMLGCQVLVFGRGIPEQ